MEEIGPLKAVLLDLDGTLADSLPALREAYTRFLAAHNVVGTSEEFNRWNGPPLREVVAGLARTHELTGDFESLFAQYLGQVESCYIQASLVPGATALLSWLEQHQITVVLVTSAPRALAESLLRTQSVFHRFAHIITADEVDAGKPSPECYVKALQAIGISAKNAVAVEDSPPGVRAARGADLRCIGIGARRLLLDGALTVAHDLMEVCDILDAIRRGACRVLAASGFQVTSGPRSFGINGAVEDKVQQLWTAALAERPSLTDGEIVTIQDWNIHAGVLRVETASVQYRQYLAQRSGLPLGIVPLGVSGVIQLPTGEVVLGRRSSEVSQYPGYWELIPSGGVSSRHVRTDGSVDIAGQLMEEMEEELGIEQERATAVHPLGMLQDLSNPVIDLGFLIELTATEQEMRDGILRHGEYEEVKLLTLEAAKNFRRPVVPTVPALLDLVERRRRANST